MSLSPQPSSNPLPCRRSVPRSPFVWVIRRMRSRPARAAVRLDIGLSAVRRAAPAGLRRPAPAGARRLALARSLRVRPPRRRAAILALSLVVVLLCPTGCLREKELYGQAYAITQVLGEQPVVEDVSVTTAYVPILKEDFRVMLNLVVGTTGAQLVELLELADDVLDLHHDPADPIYDVRWASSGTVLTVTHNASMAPDHDGSSWKAWLESLDEIVDSGASRITLNTDTRADLEVVWPSQSEAPAEGYFDLPAAFGADSVVTQQIRLGGNLVVLDAVGYPWEPAVDLGALVDALQEGTSSDTPRVTVEQTRGELTGLDIESMPGVQLTPRIAGPLLRHLSGYTLENVPFALTTEYSAGSTCRVEGVLGCTATYWVVDGALRPAADAGAGGHELFSQYLLDASRAPAKLSGWGRETT